MAFFAHLGMKIMANVSQTKPENNIYDFLLVPVVSVSFCETQFPVSFDNTA